MTKHYHDYCWKGGIPYGLRAIEEGSTTRPSETYKIVMDPYRKRIAIEKYAGNDFFSIVYDSAFIDFRHLKSVEQIAWQKTAVQTSEDRMVSQIRNQDDRLLFIETYLFEKERCRECQTHSPLGHLLSRQKMSYKSLGDAFDGVTLFDANERPVMRKRYAVDASTAEFTEVLEEIWDGKHLKK